MLTIDVPFNTTHLVPGPDGTWFTASKLGLFRLGEETPLLPGPSPKFAPVLRAVDVTDRTLSFVWDGSHHSFYGRWQLLSDAQTPKLIQEVRISPVLADSVYDVVTHEVFGTSVAIIVGKTSGVSFCVGNMPRFVSGGSYYAAFLTPQNEIIHLGGRVTKRMLDPLTLEQDLVTPGELVSKKTWPIRASVAYSPARRLLLFHTERGHMVLAPLDHPDQVVRWQAPSTPHRFFFDNDGRHVIMHHRKDSVGFFDPETGHCKQMLDWQVGTRYNNVRQYHRHIAMSDDGFVCGILLSERRKKRVLLFDVDV